MPDGTKLVIGYGNPCRGDDGLGPACAQAIEARHLPGVTVDSDYQLSVEHATLVAAHRVVVFVDADPHAAEPFSFREVTASPAAGLTTHSVSPGALLDLAAKCFQATPRAFVMGIRASALEEFHEGLSGDAASCLDRAVTFLDGWLRDDSAASMNIGGR